MLKRMTFYQGLRGPAPKELDTWCLVLNQIDGRLVVRHEWETAGHNGFDEFDGR
jgi:hypothetical protein